MIHGRHEAAVDADDDVAGLEPCHPQAASGANAGHAAAHQLAAWAEEGNEFDVGALDVVGREEIGCGTGCSARRTPRYRTLHLV